MTTPATDTGITAPVLDTSTASSATATERTVPVGAFFFNTVWDFSYFAVDAPIAGLPEALAGNDNEWTSVVDYGVTGDGSDETAKIQAAIDGSQVPGTKTKILVPAGLTVSISAQHLNNCITSGYFQKNMVCLFLDSNVTFRVDGTLKVLPMSAAEMTFPSSLAVFENRNSFWALCFYLLFLGRNEKGFPFLLKTSTVNLNLCCSFKNKLPSASNQVNPLPITGLPGRSGLSASNFPFSNC